MDLRNAIEKATRIPRSNENATFVKLRKPDQATIDRNMNKRVLRPPRNIKLVEPDDTCLTKLHDWNSVTSLNEHEILSSIKAVNGGVNYSNKYFEDQWKSKQPNCTSNVELNNTSTSSSKSSCSFKSDIETSNESIIKQYESKEKTEQTEGCVIVQESLQKCKFSKNAVILGLLNSNKITLEDLKIPKQLNLKNEDSLKQSDTQTDNIPMGECLIQHPDEPDVYIHPLQMMEELEKSKKSTTDFMINYVGVKKTITPRQYYINETDDASFEFIKNNVEDK